MQLLFAGHFMGDMRVGFKVLLNLQAVSHDSFHSLFGAFDLVFGEGLLDLALAGYEVDE